MQRSIYLAKLLGPVLVVIGLGILLNGPVYLAMAKQFLNSHALIYLSGVLTMLGGIALVHAHHEWKGDWRTIITIVGWLGIIGGLVRVLVPQYVETYGMSVLAQPVYMVIVGFVVLVAGAMLVYFGYADSFPAQSRKRVRKRSRR